MSLLDKHPRIAIWGATMTAALTMAGVTVVMDDDPVITHWLEILVVSVAIHIVMRAAHRRKSQ